MVNILDYKRAKEFLAYYKTLHAKLDATFKELRQWENDPTVRNLLDDLEQGMLRLERRAKYERSILEER